MVGDLVTVRIGNGAVAGLAVEGCIYLFSIGRRHQIPIEGESRTVFGSSGACRRSGAVIVGIGEGVRDAEWVVINIILIYVIPIETAATRRIALEGSLKYEM